MYLSRFLLLLRRRRRYDASRLRRRIENGRLLTGQLPNALLPNPGRITSHNFWVFPVLADDPSAYVGRLRAQGIDATARTRLAVVPPPADRPDLTAVNATRLLTRVVFVPCYPEVPRNVLNRMGQASM